MRPLLYHQDWSQGWPDWRDSFHSHSLPLSPSSSLQIRHIFSDFAVFISVVVWVVVDVLARVDTPKLSVPNVFEHGVYTNRNRSFLINPLGM